MIKKLIIVFILLELVCTSAVFAQVNLPWNKSNVKTRIQTSVARLDTSYRYQYVIVNDSTSPERLEVLRLEVGDIGAEWGGTIKNFIDPILKKWEGWTDVVTAQPSDPTAKGIVLWDVSDSTSSVDELYSPSPSSLVQRESIQVSFESKGLPSIKRFWGTGWIKPITEEQYDSLTLLGYTDQNIFLRWYTTGAQGKTVAPLLPPSPFDSLKFLDTLKSYTTQSQLLGWIVNQNTVTKYTAFFDSVKVQLQRNDLRKARTTLDTVIVNTQQDSSGIISSEAYALIYFNTKYLLGRLPLLPPQYSLTAVSSGHGTVAKSPDLQLYDSATVVTVTAQPDSHYHFLNWSGGKTGTINPDTVRMTSNRTASANFAIDTIIITATAGANGSISPSGSVKVTYEANQSFTITPNNGYHADSLIVDNVNQGAQTSYTFTNVIVIHTIRAVFKINTYAITTTAGANGTISPGTVNINHGANQTFTITPNPGYRLDSLFIDGSSIGRYLSYTFTNVTSLHSITAKFAPSTITITRSVAANWNMVSVPDSVSNFSKTAIYPTAISNAFAYGTGYLAKDTLANGPGYWVKFPGQQSVIYTGKWLDSVTVPLNNGWSMIGVPSEDLPSYRVIAKHSSIVSPFFGYSTSYTADSILKTGSGYWVKLSQADTLVIGGRTPVVLPPINPPQPPPPPGAPPTPTLVSPGYGALNQSVSPTISWNTSETATLYRLQVSTNSSFTAPLVYDNATISSTSQQVAGLAYSTTYYWKVYASNQFGASNWSIIRWFKTQAPPCECCLSSTTSLDAFTFTDATGNSQQLFVRNGNRPLKLGFTDVEMPPKPIAGLFHARFATNKFIETAPVKKSTQLKIAVSDAKGTVKLSWNVLPENSTKYWLIRSGQPKVLLTGTGSMDVMTTSSGTIIITTQAEPPPCEQ